MLQSGSDGTMAGLDVARTCTAVQYDTLADLAGAYAMSMSFPSSDRHAAPHSSRRSELLPASPVRHGRALTRKAV